MTEVPLLMLALSNRVDSIVLNLFHQAVAVACGHDSLNRVNPSLQEVRSPSPKWQYASGDVLPGPESWGVCVRGDR